MKYEDVYLKAYTNIAELTVGLAQYFAFYNTERTHQALGYDTSHVHCGGVAGGALIFDKFGNAQLEQEQDGSRGCMQLHADSIRSGWR